MEKICQKGYFLVETIISLTVVATVITILYATITTSFINQNDELTKFNTIEGMYIAKEVDKYFKLNLDDLEENITDTNKYIDLDDYINTNNNENLSSFRKFNENLNIKKIYFSNYDMKKLIEDKINVSMKKNLLVENNKDTNRCNYRYLVIFKDNTYATVGIECN